jgi:hypothetical protein
VQLLEGSRQQLEVPVASLQLANPELQVRGGCVNSHGGGASFVPGTAQGGVLPAAGEAARQGAGVGWRAALAMPLVLAA